MTKKRIIIIIVIITAIIGCALGWHLWDQNQKNIQFKAQVVSIIRAHRIIVEDVNTVSQNMQGRNFDNIFTDLNALKQKNMDLKIKAAELTPQTKESEKISADLNNTLSLFDNSLTSVITTVEKQRTWQFESSINKDSEKATEANTQLKMAIKSANDAVQQYGDSFKTLQDDLGITFPPLGGSIPGNNSSSPATQNSNPQTAQP